MHTFQLTSQRLETNSVTFNALVSLLSKGGSNEPITMNVEYISQFAKKGLGKVQWAFFIIFVDCLAIVEKVNVETDADILEIKDAVNHFLLPSATTIDDFKVVRVDYCHNTVVHSLKERVCLCELLNKMPANTNYLRQETTLYGETVEYSMGCRRINKSRGFQIYDKNHERKEKQKPTMHYERDVIRAELQLQPDGLQYRRKRKKAPRTFDFWVNLDMERHLLEEARRIFPKSDFWPLDEAVNRINRSHFKPTMKAKLIAYLSEVANLKNMDEISPKFACPQTINGYIKRLEEINVNPVTIPRNKGIFYIKNPIY